MHRLHLNGYIILSLDTLLHESLLKIHAPSFLVSEWSVKQEPLYRWKLAAEALMRGFDVIHTEPVCVWLRDPIQLAAQSSAHIVAGDLLAPTSAAERSKEAAFLAANKKAGPAAEDRIDVNFIYFRSSAHVANLIPRFLANIRQTGSSKRALNLLLSTGYVRWSARDPESEGKERPKGSKLPPPSVVIGSSKSNLQVHLWPDSMIKRFGCAEEGALRGVIVLNCIHGEFAFGTGVQDATRAQVSQSGLRQAGAWFLSAAWKNINFPGHLHKWLGMVAAYAA